MYFQVSLLFEGRPITTETVRARSRAQAIRQYIEETWGINPPRDASRHGMTLSYAERGQEVAVTFSAHTWQPGWPSFTETAIAEQTRTYRVAPA